MESSRNDSLNAVMRCGPLVRSVATEAAPEWSRELFNSSQDRQW
jgi:hypothetical protein